MHASGSKDGAAFQREFERILDEAGTGVADFTLFVFPSADYERREFKARCVFYNVAFAQPAVFFEARFEQDAEFTGAAFKHNAIFGKAWFMGNVTFLVARFDQEADFSQTTFSRDAEFSGATFAQHAEFIAAAFKLVAYFIGAKFLGTAGFRGTEFREDEGLLPGPVFCLAEFSRPETIVFYKTYLGQALFHNCDVSKLNFSAVYWRERRKNGKRMVFEEVVTPVSYGETTRALRPKKGDPNERDYGLIAELYQQLKKNYDERKDYWTAGDFHYGEMEMKRMHSRGKSRSARWFHRNLGLVAWYKYASQYGESYARPFVVLMIVLGIFTLLFPWAGLERNESTPHSPASAQAPPAAAASELSYRHFHDFVRAYPGRKWTGPAAFFGNSLMTVLSVAGFQKELKYEPSYPWGRALALLELLLTSTLIALFLLAVRRQFKR